MRHRGCSRPLRRVVTGFGADVAFARAGDKLVGHYGILLAPGTIRRATETHAQAICAAAPADEARPSDEGSETVVVETGGGMAPVVGAGAAQKGRRKGKKLQWKEAGLCLAHEAGGKTPGCGGTLQGDAAEAGKQLFGKSSRVHAAGDGARCKRKSGSAAEAATRSISTAPATIRALPQRRSMRVRRCQRPGSTNRKSASRPGILPGSPSPCGRISGRARWRCAARRYDPATAICLTARIGSGEIGSAHRRIVQKRLKLPGPWRCAENAEHMPALRLNRANEQWGNCWNQLGEAA